MSEIFMNDWATVLNEELEQDYYQKLTTYFKKEYSSQQVYPDMEDIYNAFHFTPYQDTKIVILGQDPYHGPNQAHGFSFSVKPGVQIPPSLRNIYKELEQDLEVRAPNHGCLINWAKQGVLLLNTVLTVRAHQAHSHKGIGWEQFTDRVIEQLNEREQPIVFILWGRPAQQKIKRIDTNKHFIITAPHPSPLSAHRGFFGSRPFSKANQILQSLGEIPINWEIPDHSNYT